MGLLSNLFEIPVIALSVQELRQVKASFEGWHDPPRFIKKRFLSVRRGIVQKP